MESMDALQGVFGGWPARDMSKRQDLIDLGWHEKEFQRRTSFAFVIDDAKSEKYLGCLYLYPSRKIEKGADVHMWLCTSGYSDGRMRELWLVTEEWLKASWPLTGLNFPTRKP